jgi:hypothetical protein
MSEPVADPVVDVQPDVESVKLPLGNNYGTATVSVRTDWITGRTLYEVAARNVSGTITVYPDPNPREDDVGAADELLIKFGNVLSDSALERDNNVPYPQATRVNGHVILGGTAARPQELTEEDFYTVARRRCGNGTRGWLPDRSETRLSAVVRAVCLHWLARDDLAAVKVASARYHAPRHLQAELRKAGSHQHQIDGLAAERDQHLAKAEEYRRLVSEPVADHTEGGTSDG